MTTATPGRIRRSIRFAQLDAGTEMGARGTSLRRERMTGTDKLERMGFQNAQDWVKGVGLSPSGRYQVVEEPRKKQQVFGKTGLRSDWARLIIWILAAVMCLVLLVRMASAGALSLQIQKLETRIAAAQTTEARLKSELAYSGGDISVCTRAVELNLISSNGAPTIQLTAPEGATMNLVSPQESQTTQEPEIRASVGGT